MSDEKDKDIVEYFVNLSTNRPSMRAKLQVKMESGKITIGDLEDYRRGLEVQKGISKKNLRITDFSPEHLIQLIIQYKRKKDDDGSIPDNLQEKMIDWP